MIETKDKFNKVELKDNPKRFYPYTTLFPIETRLPEPLVDLDRKWGEDNE